MSQAQPFEPPPWAVKPKNPEHRFFVYKRDQLLETYDIGGKAYYTFGSHASSDYVLENPSISRLHAIIAHHRNGKCYLIDFKSGHGTFVDGKRAEKKPIGLVDGATVCFGNSTKLYVYSSSKAKKQTEAAPKPIEQKSLRASHILVKHRDSRRPSSWKEEKVTRTKAEALQEIQVLEAKLRSNFSPDFFAKIAQEESHCSSAKRGGDLGQFEKGKMQKSFEDATLALAVGEMSAPIETESGVHLILRTG